MTEAVIVAWKGHATVASVRKRENVKYCLSTSCPSSVGVWIQLYLDKSWVLLNKLTIKCTSLSVISSSVPCSNLKPFKVNFDI